MPERSFNDVTKIRCQNFDHKVESVCDIEWDSKVRHKDSRVDVDTIQINEDAEIGSYRDVHGTRTLKFPNGLHCRLTERGSSNRLVCE